MRKIVYGVLGVGLVILAIYVYHLRAVNEAASVAATAARPTPPPQPRITHHSDALISAPFSLAANEIKRIPIVVTKEMSNVKLSGRFEASGGQRNDIEAFVFNNPGDFTNWNSGNQAKAIYQSGRTTVANIDVSLTMPATYDLVFSNKNAILLRRDVKADIKLEYEQREK